MLTKIFPLFFISIMVSQASPVAEPVLIPNTVQKRVPATVYGLGVLNVKAQGIPIVALDNGVDVYFQNSDSNFVVYQDGVAKWDSQVSKLSQGCATNTCLLVFQIDGNLVSYFNGVPTWNTETGAGKGAWLTFFDEEPYIVIYNSDMDPVWHTPTPAPVPKPVQGGGTIIVPGPGENDGDDGDDGDDEDCC